MYLGDIVSRYLHGIPVHRIMMYRSWPLLGYRVSKYLVGVSVHPLMMYSSCVYFVFRNDLRVGAGAAYVCLFLDLSVVLVFFEVWRCVSVHVFCSQQNKGRRC